MKTQLEISGSERKMAARTAAIKRKTKETNVSLELTLDGSGKWQIDTGIQMLDHFLAQIAQHSRFDVTLSARGDNDHHLIEDIAICLGKAFDQALGDKQGIVRMADASVPMDDALAVVALDICGRGYCVLDLPFSRSSKKWELLGFSPDLIRHFFESFAAEAKISLHAHVLYGENDHHKAEALFKALARALDKATRIDQRIKGLPSTKDLM